MKTAEQHYSHVHSITHVHYCTCAGFGFQDCHKSLYLQSPHPHSLLRMILTIVSSISRLLLSRILYQYFSMRDPARGCGSHVTQRGGGKYAYPYQAIPQQTHKPSHFSRRNELFCLRSLKMGCQKLVSIATSHTYLCHCVPAVPSACVARLPQSSLVSLAAFLAPLLLAHVA